MVLHPFREIGKFRRIRLEMFRKRRAKEPVKQTRV